MASRLASQPSHRTQEQACVPKSSAPSNSDSCCVEGARFIDVRAEIEFARGAIPGAVNLPILTTAEREQVGTCYKRQGQEAAVALGHRLVSGTVREQRIARWCAELGAHPDALVYCWRGGMRSGLAAEWIAAEGVPVRLIKGGYKALRQRLLRELEAPQPREPLYVIGGRTGSAKTDLIKALPWSVDLEELAHHRGSSFGRRVGATPAQTDFENRLALALLRRRHALPGTALFLEDESRMIGSISVPLDLHQAMKAAPLVIIDAPFESRVEQILRDYICEDLRERVARGPRSRLCAVRRGAAREPAAHPATPRRRAFRHGRGIDAGSPAPAGDAWRPLRAPRLDRAAAARLLRPDVRVPARQVRRARGVPRRFRRGARVVPQSMRTPPGPTAALQLPITAAAR